MWCKNQSNLIVLQNPRAPMIPQSVFRRSIIEDREVCHSTALAWPPTLTCALTTQSQTSAAHSSGTSLLRRKGPAVLLPVAAGQLLTYALMTKPHGRKDIQLSGWHHTAGWLGGFAVATLLDDAGHRTGAPLAFCLLVASLGRSQLRALFSRERSRRQ